MRSWHVEEQAEFTEFYRSSRDDCLRIVLVNVGDQVLAEDLVAEGFSRAWASWQKVRRHPAPRAWVVRTALNAHVSWWRRRRHEVALADHDLAAPADRGGGLNRPVTAALRRLPARQRQVITLRLLLDLDTEGTARVLRISPETVRVHLHRAIAALRAECGPARGQEPAHDREPIGHSIGGKRHPDERNGRSADE
ncbi:MAG: sigma-70 family RNA polymerase sigma factor [Actinobacteria bacterium]|nr:sigma-70 family RNA polymerase sigma factor [Actinomycetota bacterium]